jgi:hypothetical protein
MSVYGDVTDEQAADTVSLEAEKSLKSRVGAAFTLSRLSSFHHGPRFNGKPSATLELQHGHLTMEVPSSRLSCND